jgi:hypothetical protein
MQSRGFPDDPGSPNQYSPTPPSPNQQTDFFTGLDVCIPDDPNSVPTPFVP